MTTKTHETKVDGLTVKLYKGLDGDYHVTREDSQWEHDHEIFDDYDKAKAFFDLLAEDDIDKAKAFLDSLAENKPYSFDDRSLPKNTLSKEREKEIDSMMEKMLPEARQRLKELMKDYVFLKKADDSEDVYYAIDSAKIETLNLCDTYDRFGQKVGHTDAGDYHPDNSYSPAYEECLKAVAEKFVVNTEGATFRGDEIEFEDDPGSLKEIQAFVTAWIEENQNLETCEGFTYWDGHNWQTIITACEQDSAITHQVVDDETLVAELAQAIASREFVKEEFGEKIYKSDNGYYVIDSYVQGTWDAYRIVPEAEYEYQQEQRESEAN